jgi:hypothetical protein
MRPERNEKTMTNAISIHLYLTKIGHNQRWCAYDKNSECVRVEKSARELVEFFPRGTHIDSIDGEEFTPNESYPVSAKAYARACVVRAIQDRSE